MKYKVTAFLDPFRATLPFVNISISVQHFRSTFKTSNLRGITGGSNASS